MIFVAIKKFTRLQNLLEEQYISNMSSMIAHIDPG